LIDLLAVDRSLITFRPQEDVFHEGLQEASWLSGQVGIFRIFSPSYSLPQQTAARFKLELADGVDPLQLADYSKFMEEATGVQSSGYSVTLPSYSDGDPVIANAGMIPDMRALGLLNVRFVASEFEISAPGLLLQGEFGNTRIYENADYLPRAWLQPDDFPLGQQAVEAQVTQWLPNRIEISARGPGLLILSEIAYPGWRARVDGIPVEVEEAAGLLRAVPLEAGDHQVTFTLRPVSLYLGLILALIGLVIFYWAVRFQGAGEQGV